MGGGGLYRVEFLCHEFCANILCTICSAFLRIFTGKLQAVSLLTCTMSEDLVSDKIVEFFPMDSTSFVVPEFAPPPPPASSVASPSDFENLILGVP